MAAHRSRLAYVWTALALASGVGLVVLSWHAGGGTVDPTALPPGRRLSTTTVVIDSAILVLREGLETILVLAAVMASFRGANAAYRRPVALGGTIAFAAGVATWFAAVWLIGFLGGGSGLQVQAATGIPAIVVLLIVMNWFFHKVYWTGWISHHNRRRRGLMASAGSGLALGFVLLGFTSVYRECFEVVVFLQSLRVAYGASVVLEGVTIGLMFTLAIGVLTFRAHAHLPYKRLLIVTGVMLLVVLLVAVGEEINEMQLAGWIGTTAIAGVRFPAWAGTWLSLFANWQTVGAQLAALTIVIGSYFGAQYLRVWRPRRQGRRTAVRPVAPPPVVGVGRAGAPAGAGAAPAAG